MTVIQYMINHHDGWQQIFTYLDQEKSAKSTHPKIGTIKCQNGDFSRTWLRRVLDSNVLAYFPSSTSKFILVPVSVCKESLHIYRYIWRWPKQMKFYIFTIQHGQLQLQVESLLIFSGFQEQDLAMNPISRWLWSQTSVYRGMSLLYREWCSLMTCQTV